MFLIKVIQIKSQEAEVVWFDAILECEHWIICALCVYGEEEMWALFFRSLLRCMLAFKAFLSMIAFGLWTRFMVRRCSLLADAILQAQQSSLGSSQPLTSPRAIGSQFQCFWLPQEIWLGCWWHTQTDWAGAGTKYTPNYSWHINFMLWIRYTSCYFFLSFFFLHILVC